MPRSSYPPPSSHHNKYGLLRNYVVSLNRGRVSDQAEVWLRTRDEVESLLLDLLDAYRAGLIGEKRYDREKRRLDVARWTADQRYERALRTSKRGR